VSWYVVQVGGEAHVLPARDLVEHRPDEECVCGPTVEHVPPGWLYTHHSLDGRELPRITRKGAP
jgi:hypothetical protein